MKKQVLAAAALLLVTSGAALATPVSVNQAVNDHISVKKLTFQSNIEAGQGGQGGVGAVYNVPAVPLPAAGWMLLAGVAGIAALRRRAKV